VGTIDDRTTMFSTTRHGRAALVATTAALALGPLALAGPAAAAPAPPTSAPALTAGTRFFTPLPDPGAAQQVIDLGRQHRFTDAALIAKEVATPQAVWFTDGTPREVQRDVRRTVLEAKAAKAVPTLVVYNAPGRDCAQYSAGGAAGQADYEAWADGFARGLVADTQVVVVIEPDGLANLPSDCGAAYTSDPANPTDAERIAEIRYAGEAIERANPKALVYLDSGHSGWHSVADSTARLDAAGVAEFAGFSLNVSNYQWTANLSQYGTWVAECLALHPDAETTTPSDCGDQYYSGGPANGFVGGALDPARQWSDSAPGAAANTAGINSRYAAELAAAGVTPTAHFVLDTSRNGRGPWSSAAYADDQDWCNPPGRGLGPQPQARPDAAFPQLDAYLWIKTPGQSDGQCNRGIAGSTTDPEWGGIVDPAAGAWFPQQALQLAQLAAPRG
jgi:endoglucanase